MLTVIRTPHSRHPPESGLRGRLWRLAWHGQPVADLCFRTQREAQTACRDLCTIAAFALPSPDAWAPAIRAQSLHWTRSRVAAYVASLPCVQELERLRRGENNPTPTT